MFFILALAAMLGYSLHYTLMARLWRHSDPLVVCSLRGIALMLIMSPLLPLAPGLSLRAISPYLAQFLLAGLLNVLVAVATGRALRRLKVGWALALTSSTYIITICLVEVWRGIVLGPVAIFWIGMIVGMNIACSTRSATRTSHEPKHLHPVDGVWAGLSGALSAFAYVLVSDCQQSIGALATTYLFESVSGVLALFCVLASRQQRAALWEQAPGLKAVFMAAAPAAAASGCFFAALNFGSLSVLSVITSAETVTAAFLARLVYSESLTTTQWFAIVSCYIAIAGLSLSLPA